MKNFKLNITVMLAFLVVFNSCQKDEPIDLQNSTTEESLIQDGMIQLGKKLENPYTVENMRKAYQNLKSNSQLKSSSIDESEIQLTHYYVRFLPKTFEELAILQNDTTLELFDYPLDYEIEEGGTYYQDPELSDTVITWQYCTIEKDFNFPEIEYEILAKLFLPETMEDDNLKSSSEWTVWDDIEIEALRITGNLEDTNESNLKSTMRRKKWKPSGTIRVNDDSGLGLIPVVGCKARAYSWFTIKSDLTDNNGYFYINHNFKGHVNYSIKWERADFDIRSGNWGQAYYNGPRLKEKAWNLNISSGMSWVYAHIHRGAYTYYYANTWGIKSPPKNGGFFSTRIKIGAMDKSGRAHYYDFNKFFTTPQIKIYRKDSYGNTNTSEELFGTAVHELAHASHWEIGYTYGQYIVDAIFSEPFLPESWAMGVESEITSDVYGDNYEKNQTSTINQIKGNGGYTPIVIDLIDNFNQRSAYGSSYPIDRVSGYTLKQLEDALYGAYTWTAWRDKIKSKYYNPNESYLNESFANYI